MERNNVIGNVVYVGELEAKAFLVGYLRAYKFRNQNKSPVKIVLPNLEEVEGVRIQVEEKKIATRSR